MTKREEEQGWEVRMKGENGRYLSRVKLWRRGGVSAAGVRRNPGDVMWTSELIEERGYSSYALKRIPAYRMVADAMEQGLKMAQIAQTVR